MTPEAEEGKHQVVTIELGAVRYGALNWIPCDSLTMARQLSWVLKEENLAYPALMRINGVVRLILEPDGNLVFRWRRVKLEDGNPLEDWEEASAPMEILQTV